MKRTKPSTHRRRQRLFTAFAGIVAMAVIAMGAQCDKTDPTGSGNGNTVSAAGDWFLEGLFDGADAYFYRLILSQTEDGVVSGDAVQGRYEGIFGGGVPGPIPRPISGSVSGGKLTLLFDWYWDGSETTVVLTYLEDSQGRMFRAGDLELWPCDVRATCQLWKSRRGG